ncbi:MAG: hypothetical protein R3D33_06240 [Hyphomicrobiaceae bacterium]
MRRLFGCICLLALLLAVPLERARAYTEAEINKAGVAAARALTGLRVDRSVRTRGSYDRRRHLINFEVRLLDVDKSRTRGDELARLREAALTKACQMPQTAMLRGWGLGMRAIFRDRRGQILAVATLTAGYC